MVKVTRVILVNAYSVDMHVSDKIQYFMECQEKILDTPFYIVYDSKGVVKINGKDIQTGTSV